MGESGVLLGESIRFYGSFQHVLDGKGRVSLPASFRAALSGEEVPSLVLTNFICDGARCLEGFSKRSWEEFEEKLASRGRFDPQVKKLENYYFARASECVVDKSGRIVIPSHLLQYASLEKEIVFTASLNGFRIWDNKVWNLIFNSVDSALLDDPGLFKEVDI